MKGTPLVLVPPPGAEPSTTTKIEHADDGAIIVHKHYHFAAPDELVAFPFGLEEAAASSLVRSGKLRAPKIGRKRYAKRSDVVALVDTLADEQPATSTAPAATYAELVRKVGAR